MSNKELSGSGTEGDTAVWFVLVAAIADNHVIGRDDDMPWHLPEDLRQFRQTTTDHLVAMGRKTYESIAHQLGGPLPERHSIVLTAHDLDLPEGAEAVESAELAVVAAEDTADEMDVETVYVVGGATIYEQFPSRAMGLVLIELDTAHEGDTRSPEWDRGKWVETDRDDHDGFSFVTYERKQPAAVDRGTEESDK